MKSHLLASLLLTLLNLPVVRAAPSTYVFHCQGRVSYQGEVVEIDDTQPIRLTQVSADSEDHIEFATIPGMRDAYAAIRLELTKPGDVSLVVAEGYEFDDRIIIHDRLDVYAKDTRSVLQGPVTLAVEVDGRTPRASHYYAKVKCVGGRP